MQWISTPVFSVFYTGVTNFSFKKLLSFPHDSQWTKFQTHCFSENLVALGIEPVTYGSAARNSDH
jgi:hypothetical protein